MIRRAGLHRWARRLRGEHGGPLLLASAVVLVPSVGRRLDPGFREDELVCEEAAAHVAHCCRLEPANVATCDYYVDCNGEEHHPSIGPERADCLRLLPCRALVERGLCAEWTDARAGDTLPCE